MSSRCPGCLYQFSSPNHIPQILPLCLHNICSSCVNMNTNLIHGKVQCLVPTCKERNKQQDESLLSFDSHLLGLKELQRLKIKNNKERFSDDDVNFHQSPKQKTCSGSLKCTNCSDNLASKSCRSCMSNYCSVCFPLVHSTPVMSTHRAVQNDTISSFLLKNCQEHGRLVEFVSLDTGKFGCSFCTIHGDMRGHVMTNLQSVRLKAV